jgi:cysteine-rich repeat protein
MHMIRTLTFAALLFGIVAAPAQAAGDPLTCRKAVNKATAALYKTVLKTSTRCYALRMKHGGAEDCLDLSVFDPSQKVAGAAGRLVSAMTDTPSSSCGDQGEGFFLACDNAPPACAAACACVRGSSGADIGACLACRVTDIALRQVDEIYGSEQLTPDSAAAKCLNTVGKVSAKSGATRMKEQQSCQAQFDSNKLRGDCRGADPKSKITKINSKSTSTVLKTCKLKPGADQVPELTGAACMASSAAGAAQCALDEARTASEAVFDLASAPGGIYGFIAAVGSDGVPLPLRNVRVEVAGANAGAKTDKNGYYEIQGVPPGWQTQVIDGQGVGPYPRIGMGFPAPLTGLCPMGIFAMPEIDMANAIDVGAMLDGSNTLTQSVTLDNPTLPGASIELAAGMQITFDVPNRAPLLSISSVPAPVMPFPPDVFSDEIFTIQPENTTISPPAVVSYPNNLGLPPSAQANVWLPDFPTNTFYLAGTGTVSPAGDAIVSDAPVISRFDWGFVGDPNAPIGCTTIAIGRVLNADTLLPIQGAQVQIQGAFTTSTADGTFALLIPLCTSNTPAMVSAVLPATGTYVAQWKSVSTVFNGTTDFGDFLLQEPDCGNGQLEFGEQCDDGNNDGGDGCSPICRVEVCGNGTVDPGEECDGDPNCTNFCTICGNGIVRTPGEECDAGAQNGVAGSGCSATCKVTICGNGVREEGEQCDLGEANGGSLSFCDTSCRIKSVGMGGVEGSIVRHAASCPGPYFPMPPYPDTETQDFTPACSPILVESAMQFGASGVGTASAALVTGGADVVLAATVNDVRLPDGITSVTSAVGWRVAWTLRVTLLDASDGASQDVTLENLTVETSAVLDGPGNLRAATSLFDAFPMNWTLYRGRNVQVVNVEVIDPSNEVFGRMGWTYGSQWLTADVPASAKVVAGPMVRSYVPCGGSITFPSPNTQAFGVGACIPALARSPFHLSPAGNASFASNVVGSDIRFAAVLQGVMHPDGITPVTSPDFHLITFVRASIVDPQNGEMTVIDAPFAMAFPITDGNGVVSIGFGQILDDMGLTPFGTAQIALVGGMATINDSDEAIFARLGLRAN